MKNLDNFDFDKFYNKLLSANIDDYWHIMKECCSINTYSIRTFINKGYACIARKIVVECLTKSEIKLPITHDVTDIMSTIAGDKYDEIVKRIKTDIETKARLDKALLKSIQGHLYLQAYRDED